MPAPPAFTYDTYREQLRALDPGNDAIIQGKLGRFVFKNYDKYPDDKALSGEQGNGRDVRILRGDKAKADADFAELSKRATPHAVISGQHTES